jgi:hypothetical protein
MTHSQQDDDHVEPSSESIARAAQLAAMAAGITEGLARLRAGRLEQHATASQEFVAVRVARDLAHLAFPVAMPAAMATAPQAAARAVRTLTSAPRRRQLAAAGRQALRGR